MTPSKHLLQALSPSICLFPLNAICYILNNTQVVINLKYHDIQWISVLKIYTMNCQDLPGSHYETVVLGARHGSITTESQQMLVVNQTLANRIFLAV